MKLSSTCLFLCMAGLVGSSCATDRLQEPYAICAHVSRAELEIAQDEFEKLSQIPVTWVRTDFDWSNIQPNKDTWNYGHLDKLMDIAKTNHINILPILDYHVPWASPSHEHLDQWAEYVQKTVSRYANGIRYWEVWNEQNGFWPMPAKAEDYVPLLKRSYETIKAIDPKLQVLYGGTAGVPIDYIETTLKAGAGPYFDIMNVHPYNWRSTPEAMVPQLTRLKELMIKYGVGRKPIWITEVGWSTAVQNHVFSQAFIAAFRRLGIAEKRFPLAVVDMEASLNQTPAGLEAFFDGVRFIGLDGIASLSPKECPVLMPCSGESFPAQYHDALRAFMAKGGTLLLPSGLPFYYDIQLKLGEPPKTTTVTDRDMAAFHLAWKAWWIHKGTPEHMTYLKPAPDFANVLETNWKGKQDVRFLDDRGEETEEEHVPVSTRSRPAARSRALSSRSARAGFRPSYGHIPAQGRASAPSWN